MGINALGKIGRGRGEGVFLSSVLSEPVVGGLRLMLGGVE